VFGVVLMLKPISRRIILRGTIIGFVGFLMVFSSVQGSIDAAIESQDPIEILLLMDDEYGGNVPHIIGIFERYGWSITTTGLNQTLISCSYLGFAEHDVDILLTDITDITEYDAISIMPGSAHESLRTNQSSLDLINSAVSGGLVVSAWCSGVRVLAAADVIDGKNITGNADYIVEYEAAGATFNELVPPIIDGNIVTGVRSRFYREEMCEAIATALGVYESDIPELVSVEVDPYPSLLGTDVNFTVEVNDFSGIYNVVAKVFVLNDTTGERVSNIDMEEVTLHEASIGGVYQGFIESLELGNYTIDLTVWDIFLNEVTFGDAVSVLVVESLPSPTSTSLDPMLIVVPIAVIGTALVVVLVIYLRRR
jgi:hypothetical protein